ncbi:MAG TPA: helix-turn-helix transcriptional regulator [Planktothrix sp.]|jgi:transcriptional regulator with XRE-family HTH domain
MKQSRPLPKNIELAPTLARRVQQLREFRNMTVRDVAKETRFPVQRVEELEQGVETWLSAADRQLLAKALSVEPMLLQEVEMRAIAGHHGGESQMLNHATTAQLSESILNGARDLECPDCGSTLKCSIQQGIDMDGFPIGLAKAFCIKCPFILR